MKGFTAFIGKSTNYCTLFCRRVGREERGGEEKQTEGDVEEMKGGGKRDGGGGGEGSVAAVNCGYSRGWYK